MLDSGNIKFTTATATLFVFVFVFVDGSMAFVLIVESESLSDVCNDGRGYDLHKCRVGMFVVFAEVRRFVDGILCEHGR